MQTEPFGVLLGLACLTLAGAASAAPSDEQAATPGPGPSAAPGRKGFVASVGVGPGLFFASSGAADDARRFNGGSVALQVLLGGHVTRNFSIGGVYLRDQIFGLQSTDAVVDGDEPNLEHISFFLSSVGLFADVVIFEKTPELHLQAFLCRGQLFVDGRTGSSVDNPTGWVYAFAATSEFRLGERATLGAGLRLTVAPLDVTEVGGNEVDVNALLPALLVTGRYD